MMRLLKRLGLYRRAYKPTTGRPWTYQIRDWSRHHPWRVWPLVGLTTAAFFAGQIELAIWFGWKAAPFVAFADFMAFVAGHLWWGSGRFTRSKEEFR